MSSQFYQLTNQLFMQQIILCIVNKKLTHDIAET